MKIRFEKDLPVLLFALVSASTVAALPQVESAWTGVKEVYGEQDFGLRILRELMLLVLVAYAFFEPRLRNGALSSTVLAFLAVVATYVLFEIGYALYLDLPLVVPMAGLRVFEYLPLALIGFVTSRLGAGELYHQSVRALSSLLHCAAGGVGDSPGVVGAAFVRGVVLRRRTAVRHLCQSQPVRRDHGDLRAAVLAGSGDGKMGGRQRIFGLAERFADCVYQFVAGGLFSDLCGAPPPRSLGFGHAGADTCGGGAGAGVQPVAQRTG